jgi:hypothetical protein
VKKKVNPTWEACHWNNRSLIRLYSWRIAYKGDLFCAMGHPPRFIGTTCPPRRTAANVKKVGINYRTGNRIIAGLKNATLKKT